ncbi:hypothetical protein V6N12_069476 [Hibiscus sabdariffa]|uniref:Uncharacterized protein n=1 Tax=Hibiscus sabdariffa TaxID=183260 RepID=A0ABR2FE00_9ROSI
MKVGMLGFNLGNLKIQLKALVWVKAGRDDVLVYSNRWWDDPLLCLTDGTIDYGGVLFSSEGSICAIFTGHEGEFVQIRQKSM